MLARICCAFIILLAAIFFSSPGHGLEQDVIETEGGDLVITFIGHASLIFEFEGLTIHIDPWSRAGNYSKLPDADLILVTHEHMDHLDEKAIAEIVKEDTELIVTNSCCEKGSDGTVMENGDTTTVSGIEIVAVPAYNIVHKQDSGQPFHPKGRGNGYIIHFADIRIYIAGDTELIPEMEELRGVDIAFLPMNLPYTMTPEMTAEAAKLIGPAILYPYHYGNTDTARLVELLKDSPGIEVRIRNM
jgi:L-ascorbate metabolism protein UlaG (beta-lactamase superfamily)